MHAFYDDILESWTRKYIAKNLWRFDSRYEFDDLYSEAWLILDKITTKYTDVSEAHLMSLYKRSLANRFHDLATEATKYRFICTGHRVITNQNSKELDEKDKTADILEITAAEPSIADSRMFANAVIAGNIVSRAYEAAMTGKIKASPKHLETHNERFDRILELPEGTNSALQLREFLRNSVE